MKAIKIGQGEVEEPLRCRGVEVVAIEGECVSLRCRVCGTGWSVERTRIEPPGESNRYWWCPNGCNREV